MDQQHIENIWKIMRAHNLELVDDVSSEFKCIICKRILINACIAPCGCRFCVECIKEYLRYGKRKCPGQSQLCEDELIDFATDIQINRVINKRISKLSVKCPNIGCQSQLELNMIEDHLRICENQPESCPYFILGCEEDKLAKDQVRDHLSLNILSHSKLLINWIRNSKNETQSMRIDIVKLKADNEKLKEKIRSDGNIIQNLQKRERENSTEIEILNEEMCALKNSNRYMKVEMQILKNKQSEQVSQYETNIKNQNQEIDQLKTQIQNQGKEIEHLKKGCQQAVAKFEEIRQRSGSCKEGPIKLDELSQLTDVFRMDSTESSRSIVTAKDFVDRTNWGEFEWKIDNWSEKVRKAHKNIDIEVFSNPFFSHQNGYQLCLSTKPDWSNLVFHFYILRGPFDDDLPWPFDRDLELFIMNQQTSLVHESMIRKCSFFPGESALQKPTTERNESVFSFWFHISLKGIFSKPGLYRNNQIFIKFTVKPVEHPK